MFHSFHNCCQSFFVQPQTQTWIKEAGEKKSIKSLEKCSTWIKLWGRPHEQLNVSKVSAYKYVCSLVRTKIFTYKQP